MRGMALASATSGFEARVRGVLRRLTKEQRGHLRTVGAEAYRQRQREREAELESHQEAHNDTYGQQGEDGLEVIEVKRSDLPHPHQYENGKAGSYCERTEATGAGLR
ncbi:hypothetical protein J7337_013184 [Fusarium musae]|uniref:Uncharacterized protein n=1 Tax=Fusarium musae TaxID=1042133 RepID=A0A9P8D424_9HYPO|nr:hypothetical protein J7337_013184 [Fusarium musae]KAG9494955.1 hypothetical protein J7337_013184 [Fusarium musae]